MTSEEVVAVMLAAARAIRTELDDLTDWGPAPGHEGQYRHDVVADDIALAVLDGAGCGVLSEESGLRHAERELLVVIDPVDGSTNASRGLPWWSTSMCALDGDGPLAAVVVNQVSGGCYQAIRGQGATLDGAAIAPTDCGEVGSAIMAISGFPERHLGWAQFRCLGAASLDMCAVASGHLDGFVACEDGLAAWDYMGAALVCQEAGAAVADLHGRDLVLRHAGARRAPAAASTPSLLREMLSARDLVASNKMG
ncbi:MAG: inositol monophosphatase family protein [Acidimicrobiales bacterium]